jgi:hypothetical protein
MKNNILQNIQSFSRIKSAHILVVLIFTATSLSAFQSNLIYDDMEHGDPYNNGWITFGPNPVSIGPDASDLPPINGGAISLYSNIVTSGTPPVYLGGFGRNLLLDIDGSTHFNFWINPDAGQEYTIEVNLQDDDNGDDIINYSGIDDEFQYNLTVGSAGSEIISGGGWQFVSIPLSEFFDDNSFLTGGNGILDAKPVSDGGNGQLIFVVFAIINNSGADISFRTDYWTFSDSKGLITDLEGSINSSGLPNGTKTSLTSSLKNAVKSLTKGNNTAAGSQIEAFINKVEAQYGKKIDGATANAFITMANAIIDAIQNSLAKNGSAETTSSIEAAPAAYKLNQNYPNPFNPSTSISFSVPNDGHVSLSIYDVLGNEVAVLEDGFKSAGTYSYSFDASDLTSGIYVYTIRSSTFVETKKMLLIK